MSHGVGQAFSLLNFQKYLWTLTHQMYRVAENMCTLVRYNLKLIISWGKQNAEDLMRGYLIAHPAQIPDLASRFSIVRVDHG